MAKLKLTEEDKAWSLEVKKRDDFKCVVCGSSERLNSHHIIPREIKPTKYDLRNGLTLCVKHHMFSRVISAHNNPLALFVWMEENKPEQLEYCRDIIRRLAA